LSHQLTALPPYEQFWQELPKVFEWLHQVTERVVTAPISSGTQAINESFRMPAMEQVWHTTTSAPLEVIRFAAANRLCVNLAYQGSTRVIEPYSLRMTREGNLLLYAVKHDTREDRSYRVDRIEGAQVTEIPFTPKYTVELTATGPISAPLTASRTRSPGGRYFRQPRVSRILKYGPTYVIECSYCGKRFNRSTNTTTLNPHKDKSGYPCSGRMGYLVDTK